MNTNESHAAAILLCHHESDSTRSCPSLRRLVSIREKHRAAIRDVVPSTLVLRSTRVLPVVYAQYRDELFSGVMGRPQIPSISDNSDHRVNDRKRAP